MICEIKWRLELFCEYYQSQKSLCYYCNMNIFIASIGSIIVVICGFFIYSFYFGTSGYYHTGHSMLPNYDDGTFVTTSTVNRPVERGDVIVFFYPVGSPSTLMMKRVVGIPGDAISISEGLVLVNGKPEEFTRIIGPTEGDLVVTLNEGEYFVLGDNRPVSSDSRNWGILSEYVIHSFVEEE